MPYLSRSSNMPCTDSNHPFIHPTFRAASNLHPSRRLTTRNPYPFSICCRAPAAVCVYVHVCGMETKSLCTTSKKSPTQRTDRPTHRHRYLRTVFMGMFSYSYYVTAGCAGNFITSLRHGLVKVRVHDAKVNSLDPHQTSQGNVEVYVHTNVPGYGHGRPTG